MMTDGLGSVDAAPGGQESRIRLPLAPVAAPRQSRRDAWDPSPAVVRYRAFCTLLGIRANQAGWQLGDTLSVVFHIAMPPSWSNKKRRAMEGQPHQQKPDTDNLVKALCDCLTTDDSHIWSIRAEKRWAVDGAIEVEGTTTDSVALADRSPSG